MVSDQVIILGSFLLAFKAVLLEGSEVAILSLATVNQIGKKNVFLGIFLGVVVSTFIFLAIRQIFLYLPDLLINFVTASLLLYFSSKFLKGFIGYYFEKRSFEFKMRNLEHQLIEDEKKYMKGGMQFPALNSLPVFTITLTEGFEASLVLAAAGSFNLFWTVMGASVSIGVISIVSAFSYRYLVNFPRWLLDLIAGFVLLTFGLIFLTSGLLEVIAKI